MVVQRLRPHALTAGGPGLDPWDQETRSHMLQLRVHMLQLNSLCAHPRPSAAK